MQRDDNLGLIKLEGYWDALDGLKLGRMPVARLDHSELGHYEAMVLGPPESLRVAHVLDLFVFGAGVDATCEQAVTRVEQQLSDRAYVASSSMKRGWRPAEVDNALSR